MQSKMSRLVLSLLFVATWVFMPARNSRADSVSTKSETFSSSSNTGSPAGVSGYNSEYSESRQSVSPGAEEQKSEVETYRSSDADVTPPVGRDYDYQYKSEQRESREVAPAPPAVVVAPTPPAVVEHDRTIVEHDVPTPPSEGRLQAWWHRNFHRDTD